MRTMITTMTDPVLRPVFITATGTDIGKSYVTAGLIKAFIRAGQQIQALKPVLSGTAHPPTDADLLMKALQEGPDADDLDLDEIAPWRFAAPLSPDMAAEQEGRSIPFDALIRHCAKPRTGQVLIEGVGGVMVPLDHSHTVLDWIAALQPRILLVAGTYLGTISHTLTALSALQARGLSVDWLVLNESSSQPVPAHQTASTLTRFGAPAPFILPRQAEEATFDQLFRIITTERRS
ncbi:Dethiobiotin synthetase [Granulibacter bethesdensis]|nr:Dethiobiotin synthetase [Granulibacter bethesdensis]